MCSVKLIFAGARAVNIKGSRAERVTRSAAILCFGLLLRLGLRRCRFLLVRQTVLDLFQDAIEIFRLRLQIARMIPLEMRFELPTDAPIRVAKMIVDNRVRRLQFDCAFELFDRLIVLSELVTPPAETVDDITVGRPQFDGAAEHLERLVEIDTLIDPGIAEIIQNQRLIRKKLKRLLEIAFRFRPLLLPLVGNAAIII